MGSDHNIFISRQVGIQVSIHAPAWGATDNGDNQHILIYCFNPRSRMGSDLVSGLVYSYEAGFNPRSRRGSDELLLPLECQ